MSYRDWHVGMKVVGRTDAPPMGPDSRAFARTHGIVMPKMGEVYTIRDITIGHFGDGDKVCIRLREISNSFVCKHLFDGGEIAFNAANFRPVVPRKTDISIFTSMLSPERGKVEA